MNIILVDGSKEFEELAKSTLIKTLKHLKEEKISISVLFTDDVKMQELNKTYRSKDKPTDVLSFSMRDGDEFPSVEEVENLGDIIVSVDTAMRQAKEFGVSIEDEIKRLLVHGCLHLLGYEHEGVSDERAREMFDRQEEVLAGIG